jgi:hypothetical protein
LTPSFGTSHSRPNLDRQYWRDPNQDQKGWAMTEQSERLPGVRAEIAARVARFKAMQEKFEREREEYCVTTLENARNGSYGRRSWT